MKDKLIGKTPTQIGKGEKRIKPPENGWKENTYYIVNAAFSNINPIHRKIFFSGFITNGKPCGYNRFFSSAGLEYCDAYFLHVVREIDINE